MRLFTFGCSNTAYHYPTWADIVGQEFQVFQNWGRPSAGNNYILNAINRCHLINRFVPTDTVIILWSGLARIDYYQINDWSHMVNCYYDLSDKKIPVSCPDGYQWLSFAWMASAQHILEHLGVNYKMFYWQEIDKDTKPYFLYAPAIEKMTFAPLIHNEKSYLLHPQSLQVADLLYKRCAGPDWPKLNEILDGSYRGMDLDDFIKKELDDFLKTLEEDRSISSNVYEQDDPHPSPEKHLEWVKKYLPDYQIAESTEQWIKNIDRQLLDGKPYDFRPALF